GRGEGAARVTIGGWGWLIVLFPLAGCLVLSLGWRSFPGRTAGWLASATVFGSFVSSIGAFAALEGKSASHRLVVSRAFDYLHTAGVNVDMSIQVDPLSVFMALVVSGVSFLIHVYSVAYMGSDRGYARFVRGTKPAFSVNDGTLVAACILFLVGAVAKSAQLPLHTWLPDAMEGPTPVSALIHAATMVTAGVYLIARLHPLFEQAPAAADVAAIT